MAYNDVAVNGRRLSKNDEWLRFVASRKNDVPVNPWKVAKPKRRRAKKDAKGG